MALLTILLDRAWVNEQNDTLFVKIHPPSPEIFKFEGPNYGPFVLMEND